MSVCYQLFCLNCNDSSKSQNCTADHIAIWSVQFVSPKLHNRLGGRKPSLDWAKSQVQGLNVRLLANHCPRWSLAIAGLKQYVLHFDWGRTFWLLSTAEPCGGTAECRPSLTQIWNDITQLLVLPDTSRFSSFGGFQFSKGGRDPEFETKSLIWTFYETSQCWRKDLL